MKNVLILFVFATGLFFTACNQAVDPTVSQETLDNIQKQQSDAWAQFDKDHDVKALIDALYSDDAKFMAPNGPTAVGKQNIVAVMSSYPPFNIAFDISKAEGSGDLVILMPIYKMTAPDGSPMDEGKSIEVWKKQADGSWKIAYDIFNSNIPLPALAHEHGTVGEDEEGMEEGEEGTE